MEDTRTSTSGGKSEKERGSGLKVRRGTRARPTQPHQDATVYRRRAKHVKKVIDIGN